MIVWPLETTRPVRISLKSLGQLFVECSLEYILTVCHGRCCQGTGGISVAVLKNERARFSAEGPFLSPTEKGLCPFKDAAGTCKVHPSKPAGCAYSPFVLTGSDCLVVRNRYRLLKCYRDADRPKVPVYKAHGFALISIIGESEYLKLVEVMESGRELPREYYIKVSETVYRNLTELRDLRKGEIHDD